mmetsp:Transcript_17359/g.32906  ORF Transcript_17359/g.32906 Transcript_17359/m.32906 type:complete len:466 (+) Transcript_17359:275-1672(+)
MQASSSSAVGLVLRSSKVQNTYNDNITIIRKFVHKHNSQQTSVNRSQQSTVINHQSIEINKQINEPTYQFSTSPQLDPNSSVCLSRLASSRLLSTGSHRHNNQTMTSISQIAKHLLRPFILTVICFLIFNFSAALHKLKLTIQGIAYLIFCKDKSWPKQSDPKIFFQNIKDQNSNVVKKTIIFVRHGESTWNDTFNKGHRSLGIFVLGFLPGLIKACIYEFYLVLAGKIDSWFYDSPLSLLGLEQVQSLASFMKQSPNRLFTKNRDPAEKLILEILRKDPSAPDSILVSSSLRRAISTMAASFQDRLLKNPNESIVVLPCLQEISRNPDTLSITPPKTNVTPSWIEAAYPDVDFKAIFATQVDMNLHFGNKPIDTNGYKRMKEFCTFAFNSIDEEFIIVGGHSIWFRSFFKEFLPRDSNHVSKKKKVVNCGAVSFSLCKIYDDNGGTDRFMVDEDSIRVVYGGFQ